MNVQAPKQAVSLTEDQGITLITASSLVDSQTLCKARVKDHNLD